MVKHRQVVWSEAKRHVGGDHLLLLEFGGEEWHHSFLFRHMIASPVHRRPPSWARITASTYHDEPSSLPIEPLVGQVVLHYCNRCNNGSRWRGGGH